MNESVTINWWDSTPPILIESALLSNLKITSFKPNLKPEDYEENEEALKGMDKILEDLSNDITRDEFLNAVDKYYKESEEPIEPSIDLEENYYIMDNYRDKIRGHKEEDYNLKKEDIVKTIYKLIPNKKILKDLEVDNYDIVRIGQDFIKNKHDKLMDIKGVSWSVFSFLSAVLPAFDNWLQNLNPFPGEEGYISSWFMNSCGWGVNACWFIFSSKFWGKFRKALFVSGFDIWGLISSGIVLRERLYTPFSIGFFWYWGFGCYQKS